jgi:hypothetical protein
MATHDIEVNLPARRIVNTDVTVVVKSDGAKLGELLISKGTVDWRPAKRQTLVSMRWETFAKVLEDWDENRRRS